MKGIARPQKQRPRAVSGAGSWFLDLGLGVAFRYTRPYSALGCTVIMLIRATLREARSTRDDAPVPAGRVIVCEGLVRCVMPSEEHAVNLIVNCQGGREVPRRRGVPRDKDVRFWPEADFGGAAQATGQLRRV